MVKIFSTQTHSTPTLSQTTLDKQHPLNQSLCMRDISKGSHTRLLMSKANSQRIACFLQAPRIKPWLQMGTGRSGDISIESLATTLSEWSLIRGGTWFQTPAQTKPQVVGLLLKARPFWHLLLIYYVCASTRHMSQSGHPCFCLTAPGCFVVPFLGEIEWSGQASRGRSHFLRLLRTFNTVV